MTVDAIPSEGGAIHFASGRYFGEFRCSLLSIRRETAKMTITRAIRAAPVLADATAPESAAQPGFSVAAAGTWAFNEAPACRAVVAADADAAESAEAILLVRQLLRGRDGAAAAAACERALSAAASAEPAAAEVGARSVRCRLWARARIASAAAPSVTWRRTAARLT